MLDLLKQTQVGAPKAKARPRKLLIDIPKGQHMHEVAAEYARSNPHLTTVQVVEQTGISYGTVLRGITLHGVKTAEGDKTPATTKAVEFLNAAKPGQYNLSEAAKACGVSLMTMRKAIKLSGYITSWYGSPKK